MFIPAGLVVFFLGILMVIEGPWTFGMLWIVLGLVGYAITFVTGIALLMPRAKRIAAAMERDGGMTDQSAADTATLFRHMRIDYAVIGVVIADMALKPAGDDVGTLVLFAAIIGVVARPRCSVDGGKDRSPTRGGAGTMKVVLAVIIALILAVWRSPSLTLRTSSGGEVTVETEPTPSRLGQALVRARAVPLAA